MMARKPFEITRPNLRTSVNASRLAIRQMAAAKINLALHVTGRRHDGYHLLDTLVAFTSFGDVIDIEPGDQLSLDICGPFSQDLSNDHDNLVLRAASKLKKTAEDLGIRCGGARIVLSKNLPVSSGIGGGSADAAATLLALTDLWGLGDSGIDLATIALDLGADVPMCLYSAFLRAGGIGEHVEPVNLPKLDLVLVNPGIGVSTISIFKKLDQFQLPPLAEIPQSSSPSELASWLSRQRNDLQSAAISVAPVIGDILEVIAGFDDCRLARMSGSGATCFGLFSSMESAEQAALDLGQRFPAWWSVACKTI